MSESFDAAKLAALLNRTDDFLDQMIHLHPQDDALTTAALRLRGELVQAIGELRGQKAKGTKPQGGYSGPKEFWDELSSFILDSFGVPQKDRNDLNAQPSQLSLMMQREKEKLDTGAQKLERCLQERMPPGVTVSLKGVEENSQPAGPRARWEAELEASITKNDLMEPESSERVGCHIHPTAPLVQFGHDDTVGDMLEFADCVRQACDTITEQMKPVLDAAGLPADHPLSRLMEAKESEPETQTWRDRPSML